MQQNLWKTGAVVRSLRSYRFFPTVGDKSWVNPRTAQAQHNAYRPQLNNECDRALLLLHQVPSTAPAATAKAKASANAAFRYRATAAE